jgi:hypothetical protein
MVHMQAALGLAVLRQTGQDLQKFALFALHLSVASQVESALRQMAQKAQQEYRIDCGAG